MVSYLLYIQYGHLFWPQHTIYRCVLCPKWMTLKYRFQGQHMSNVTTDLNSQHIVSYLLPIQTMAPLCYCFRDIQHFYLHGNPYSDPKFIRKFASCEPFCAYLVHRVWSVGVSRNKKSHHPYISPPRLSAATDPKWTKLVSFGAWPNVITHTHFHVHCLKAVGMVGVEGRPYSTTTDVGFNTAAQLCCL